MKKAKSALSFILCFILLGTLLASCKGEKNELSNAVYGRYVEEDITPKEISGMADSILQFDGGVIDLITSNYAENKVTYKRWRSEDNGANWKELDMKWTEPYCIDYSEYYKKNEAPPEELRINQMVQLSDGSVLTLISKSGYDKEKDIYNNENTTIKVGLNGEEKPYSFQFMEDAKSKGNQIYINFLRVLPENRLMANVYRQPTEEEMSSPSFNGSTESVHICDAETGKTLYELPGEVMSAFASDNTLYTFDYSNKISAFNLKDGTPSQGKELSEKVMQQLSAGMNTTFFDNENNLYVASSNSVEKYSKDAEEPTKIMEGLNYLFGSPLYGMNNILYQQEDKSFIMCLSNYYDGENGSSKILRYTWDDKAIASSDYKIKIYTLQDNSSIRLGLSEYKRQHPEVTIEYEFAFEDPMNSNFGMMKGGMPEEGTENSTESKAKTTEDALRTLNTELLNGTGPDVIVLDGMAVDSFIEKGVLENLADIIPEDVIKPVVEPMYKDGKLYAFPTSINLPVLIGEKGYVDKFASLQNLIDGIVDGADKPAFKDFDPTWSPEEQEKYYQDMNGPKPEEERPVLNLEGVDDLFNFMYDANASAIFGDKAGINKDALKEFLTNTKKISDKYKLGEQPVATSGMGGWMMGGVYSPSMNSYGQRQSRLGYNQIGSFNSLMEVSMNLHWSGEISGKGFAIADSTAPMPIGEEVADSSVPETDESMPVPEKEIPESQPAASEAEESETASEEQGTENTETKLPDPNPEVVPLPALKPGVYVPHQLMGVTTTSKQKELAKDFIATMTREEVQKYDLGNGFPVTKSAMGIQYDKYLHGNTYITDEGIELIELDYDKIFSGLTTPMLTDEFLKNVLRKPINDVCSGSKTVDQAAEQIVKETEMYFAERK